VTPEVLVATVQRNSRGGRLEAEITGVAHDEPSPTRTVARASGRETDAGARAVPFVDPSTYGSGVPTPRLRPNSCSSAKTSGSRRPREQSDRADDEPDPSGAQGVAGGAIAGLPPGMERRKRRGEISDIQRFEPTAGAGGFRRR
jgi:hypothetical protein